MTYKTQYFIEDSRKEKKKVKSSTVCNWISQKIRSTWRPVLHLIERGEPKLAVTSGPPRRYVQGGVPVQW